MIKQILEFYKVDLNFIMDLPLFSIDESDEDSVVKVSNPTAIFYARVQGENWCGANIHDGDILVINRTIEPIDGDKVICFINGEVFIKYIEIRKNAIWLVPVNEKHKLIKINKDNEFLIWGVITHSIIKHTL